MLKKVEDRFEKIPRLLLSKEEAAALLKVSPNTFWERFVTTKKIKIVMLDAQQKNPYFSRRDVEVLIEQSKIEWNPQVEKLIRKKAI